MKKPVAVGLALAIVAAIAGGVFLFTGKKGPKVTDPFTFDFDASPQTARALADVDGIALLMSSSPFYQGPVALPGQQTHEFDDARKAKVEQIIADSEDLAAQARKVRPGVEEMRTAFYEFLAVLAKESPDSMKYVREATSAALRFQVEEGLAEAAYEGLKVESDSDFASSFVTYVRVGRAAQFAGLCIDDANTLVGYAAWALSSLEKTPNTALKTACEKLDRDMGKYDAIRGDLSRLAQGIGRIDAGLKQLRTADHYFACAAVEFMRESIPGLREQMKTVSPGKDLSAEELAFVNDYITSFEKLADAMQADLDSVPPSELVEVAQLTVPRPGEAWAAGEPGNYAKAYAAASAPVQTPEPPQGWLSKGWSFAKGAVKTVGHGLQTTAGLVVDMTGAAVKSVMDVGAGAYNGDNWRVVGRRILANAKEVCTNFQTCQSGVKILRNTYETLEGVDRFADAAGAAAAEQVVGKGWTSWGVGKVAKAASGLFTGLGKGVALIANRQASAGDMAVGTIEIAGAVIGGSKLILRGTQMPRFFAGLAEGTWLTGKRALNFVTGMFSRLERGNLITMARQAFRAGASTIGFRGQFQAMNELAAIIKASNAAIAKEIDRLVITALQRGSANFSGTLRESLVSFVRAKYALTLKDAARFLGSTLGKNPAEFADNIVGQWVDDLLKNIVDNALLEAPRAAELAGNWKGFVRFTDITVPESAKKQEGCNFDEFIKALKDRNIPATIQFPGVPAESGTFRMMLSVGDEPAWQSYPYTYRDGTLSVRHTIEKAFVTMSGTARLQDTGYMMEGKISATQSAKGGEMRMSGIWQVKK